MGLIAIGAVVYFAALGLGLWLTGAMPATLLSRARRALRLADDLAGLPCRLTIRDVA